MAAPIVCRNTDTSAPVLTGATGSLIALLDACLVNGYGSQAAAGWTKPFSGTNQAAYLPTSGQYLFVDDSGAGSGGAREAQVQGYETMTAITTGTNKFPSSLQYARKSATVDSTPRAWILLADGTSFLLFVATGDYGYNTFGFGATYSFLAGDAYKSILIAHRSANSAVTSSGSPSTGAGGWDGGDGSTGTGGACIARYAGDEGSYTNLTLARDAQGGSIGGRSAYFLPVAHESTSSAGPNATDGNIYLARVLLTNSTDCLRGYVRGLYQILTNSGLNDGDTFSGTGDFAGRDFVVLKQVGGGWVFALETTAWDASS